MAGSLSSWMRTARASLTPRRVLGQSSRAHWVAGRFPHLRPTRKRKRNYFLYLPAALTELDADRENVRAAWNWAVSQRRVEEMNLFMECL